SEQGDNVPDRLAVRRATRFSSFVYKSNREAVPKFRIPPSAFHIYVCRATRFRKFVGMPIGHPSGLMRIAGKEPLRHSRFGRN
ncbi:MAG: hypothetical protein IJ766_02005, partial [Clostridia bacterium]|nr:hypothetical protein [Clostridia bacterium]